MMLYVLYLSQKVIKNPEKNYFQKINRILLFVVVIVVVAWGRTGEELALCNARGCKAL